MTGQAVLGENQGTGLGRASFEQTVAAFRGKVSAEMSSEGHLLQASPQRVFCEHIRDIWITNI